MRAPTAEDKLRWMLALNMKYKPPGRFDDEDEPDLIIRPATSDGNKATENFLSSLMALQG